MDRVTQQSAASAEESASASEEMTGQTRLMEKAVEELGRMVDGGHKNVETEKNTAATAVPLIVSEEIKPEKLLLEEEAETLF